VTKHVLEKLGISLAITPSLFDLPAQVQAELWDAVSQTREILLRRFRPDGFNIDINDGESAGQTVPHAHVHAVPRYRNDIPDPRGGIRWGIPAKARYWRQR